MNRNEPAARFENFDYPTFINNPKVATFIGKDYEYFKALWAKDFKKKNSGIMTRFHWTWLGIVLGPLVWFSYRKMYRMAWLIIGFSSAAVFLEIFFAPHINAEVYYLILYFILPLMAQNIYLMHVIDFFHKNAHLPHHQLDDLIAIKGGTSIAAPFVMSVIFCVCLLAAVVFGTFMTGTKTPVMLTPESTVTQSTP